MLTLDVWDDSGFKTIFAYDKMLIERVKKCLGFIWQPKERFWASSGPDVLLDLERFKIPYSVTPAARTRADNFYLRLWEILTLRTATPEGSYGYQAIGSKMLALQRRAILADDMGLGKSKQALDAIAASDALEILVVAPKSLVWNWEAEVRRWQPDWEPVVIPDAKDTASALKLIPALHPLHPRVVIANYEKLLRLDWPLAHNWDVLIFDEAQRAKNKKTLTWSKLNTITKHSKQVYALTGTPLEIRVEELYGIMSLVRPSVFGTKTRFYDQHMLLDWTGNVKGVKSPELLKERYGPWMVRRLKRDVASQLPPKVHNEVRFDLSAAERSYYGQLEKGMDTWQVDTGEMAGDASILTQLIRFQQFTSSPELLGIPTLGRGSKFAELQALLADWDGSVLIFTRFKEMAKLLQQWLGAHQLAIIHGDITDSRERLARVNAFNAGEIGKVLIGTDALATGFSIDGADLVVHYDKLWNPAREAQREDRAHGIGRTAARGITVNVVHLLARGTLDEGMHEVTKSRQDLFDEIVNQAEEAVLRRYSLADYREMIHGRQKT